MRTLKIDRTMGDEVQGIRLCGDPKIQPEPTHVRICFPGGDVDVVRTTENDYWVHVRVDRREKGDEGEARIVDARLDRIGQHAVDADVGDFDSPDLYHLAVRIQRGER